MSWLSKLYKTYESVQKLDLAQSEQSLNFKTVLLLTYLKKRQLVKVNLRFSILLSRVRKLKKS